MRATILTLTALTGLALAAPPAVQAQNVSVELRGSITKPTGSFGDAGGINANGDAGLGGDIILSANPSLSFYGGWSREMFDCEGCGSDESINSSGFEGGVKLLMHRNQGVLPWVRGGIIAHELTVDQGGTETTSNMGYGFQVSGGLDIPLGEVLSFSPAIRYQQYQAEFDVIGDNFIVAQQDVKQLSADFGLHIHLTR
jgi:hypothetical protein